MHLIKQPQITDVSGQQKFMKKQKHYQPWKVFIQHYQQWKVIILNIVF